jgi:hypothetical protein
MDLATKTEQVVEQIMAANHPCNSWQVVNVSYFCKKYLDLLELRELEYNILVYASKE